MNWRQQERWFYWGSALAIGPALVFLPAFAYLVIQPAVRHAGLLSTVLFPVLAVLEFCGVQRLVWCCMRKPFNLLSFLGFGAVTVLVVIAAYTGVFLAVYAAGL